MALDEDTSPEDAAGITDGTTVLDAGCGIGETACWLAEHRGADVIGENITETQLETARTRASDEGLTEQTDLRYDDFAEFDTVADNSVDVVWGFESIFPPEMTVYASQHDRLSKD